VHRACLFWKSPFGHVISTNPSKPSPQMKNTGLLTAQGALSGTKVTDSFTSHSLVSLQRTKSPAAAAVMPAAGLMPPSLGIRGTEGTRTSIGSPFQPTEVPFPRTSTEYCPILGLGLKRSPPFPLPGKLLWPCRKKGGLSHCLQSLCSEFLE
jgi:hypothetical protein